MDYGKLFEQAYATIHDSSGDFFSKDLVPYHARETVVVEAPSHGKETTSEAMSFWVYLEAIHGARSGDWTGLEKAWGVLESFYVPSAQDSYADYNPAAPARYAPEMDAVSEYPTALSWDVAPGPDPLAAALKARYGDTCYSMHWLGDPDNMYGFGSLFNTFQRGAMESVWDTVPQPCVDDQKFGGPNGYLDLFVKQDAAPPAQWKYTVASDADARCVQGVIFAKHLCQLTGKPGPPDAILQKACKLGDWLTYACYDKYFLKIGTQSKHEPGDAFHGLMSWYTAFGGPIEKQGWAFRIGCSHSHSGYQNPYAAHALATALPSVFADQWETSLSRQLELFAWLQSDDGAIAGGCTNSWNGRYEDYPPGVATFYGMAYVAHPVYNNPPSNAWAGMNAWGMERVLAYYYETTDARLDALVRDWCKWVAKNVKSKRDGRVLVPATLRWSGAPAASWNGGGFPTKSATLRCEVTAYGRDVGTMASFARSLLLYAAVTKDADCAQAADTLLAGIAACRTEHGYSVEETRDDYAKFDNKVYVPPGFQGKTPHGEAIDQSSTFLSLRRKLYETDPMYLQVREQLAAGAAPTVRIHRFWAQCEIAITFAVADMLRNP